MKSKTGFLLFTGLFLMTTALSAAVLQGTVKSTSSGKLLAGAEVTLVGTRYGTVTDLSGAFKLENLPAGSYSVQASFVGFDKMRQAVTLAEGVPMQLNFQLKASLLISDEIVITANRATERETPVAFTNIAENDIKKKFTIQDIPHLFKHSPGIYVTTDGGSGMGDSGVKIRGFDEQRLQVMINGIPVNDPESKKVYWSNWGSLPSGSQSIQVQRGVGSSLYGSGAFGGSINVVTSESRSVRSLGFNTAYGMNETFKLGFDYNTGLLPGNQAWLFRLNGMWGSGFRHNSFYSGGSYYLAWAKYMSDARTLRVVLHGAPQEHAYTYYSNPASDFADYGDEYNANAFVRRNDPNLRPQDLDGEGELLSRDYVSFDNNHFHKPQFEVHFNQDMSNGDKLTSSAFVSVGRGYGENMNNYYRVARDDDGFMSMNAIFDAGSSVYQYRNYSLHQQAGFLSNYLHHLGNHDLTFGVETRYWDARHKGEIMNTFGNESTTYTIGGVSIPFEEGDLYYDYTTTKPQVSVFGHGLWRFGPAALMTDLQYSFRHYHTWEDIPGNNNLPVAGGEFEIVDADGGTAAYNLIDQTWDYSFINPKVGLNYNIGQHFSVFTNYSQTYNEPRVKYFYNYGAPWDDIDLETVTDYEFGISSYFTFVNTKLNVYRLDFDNKTLQITDPLKANEPGYDYKGRRYEIVGSALYEGIEISNQVRIFEGLSWNTSFTYMRNQWSDDLTAEGLVSLYEDDVVIGVDWNNTDGSVKSSSDPTPTFTPGDDVLTDLVDKYGNKTDPETPQIILHTSLAYNYRGFFMDLLFSQYREYYVLPTNSPVTLEVDANGDPTKTSSRLPSWFTVDLVLGYGVDMGAGQLNASLHINNLLDEDYYQIGNSYGFLKGAPRNALLNLNYTM
ncbi:MAG: TonB-dependent receptor [Candidatus Delongbacteria bacterium]|nr:TonB-dependent receptor [Candidatus Delongbacteria bacterium]